MAHIQEMTEDQERRPQTPETPEALETLMSPESLHLPETPGSPSTPNLLTRDVSGVSEMEDPDREAESNDVEQTRTMADEDPEIEATGLQSKVKSSIELLRTAATPAEEKEIISRILFDLVDTQEDARVAVGLHPQAVPALVALLRSGSLAAKVNAAAILRVLCKEEDLRVKVLLGGCIPPLLAVLGVEQQQESAAALLSILSEEVGKSNFEIAEAGGIPPLVQLLETGSEKAKEYSAIVLGNLCIHSEEIRVRVETAKVVPGLLWLLKNAGSEGQGIAARALVQLMGDLDDLSTIRSQVEASLTGDLGLNMGDVVIAINISLQNDDHHRRVKAWTAL